MKLNVKKIVAEIESKPTRAEAESYINELIKTYGKTPINIYDWFAINNAIYSIKNVDNDGNCTKCEEQICICNQLN